MRTTQISRILGTTWHYTGVIGTSLGTLGVGLCLRCNWFSFALITTCFGLALLVVLCVQKSDGIRVVQDLVRSTLLLMRFSTYSRFSWYWHVKRVGKMREMSSLLRGILVTSMPCWALLEDGTDSFMKVMDMINQPSTLSSSLLTLVYCEYPLTKAVKVLKASLMFANISISGHDYKYHTW